MFRSFFQRIFVIIVGTIVVLPLYLAYQPGTAHAAASLYVSAAGSAKVGDTVTISIMVSTGGQSTNAFEGSFSYPANLFDGVRGTFSGSICTLPVTQPDPSGGSASFSCGTPSGFSGTGVVATIVLSAKAAGSGSFGLSGCSVLANDGQGTDVTGGCSGSGISVSEPATPAPTPTPAAAGSSSSPSSSASPSGNSNPSETPNGTSPIATATSSTSPSATPSQIPAHTSRTSVIVYSLLTIGGIGLLVWLLLRRRVR